MNIFELSNEELKEITKNKEVLEKSIIETSGVILEQCYLRKVDVDLNLLFQNNELNIKIIESAFENIDKNFDKLTHESKLTLTPLVTWKKTNESMGVLDGLLSKIFEYVKTNQIEPLLLKDVNVSYGYGENKEISIIDENIEINKDTEKEVSSVSLSTEEISVVSQEDAVVINNNEEEDDNYDDDDYDDDYGYHEDAPTKEQEDFEKFFTKNVKSVLKTPYLPKVNKTNELLKSLYSRDLNKDDLDLFKFEPKTTSINKEIIEALKRDFKNPTSLSVDFLMSMIDFDEAKSKSLYLLMSNDDALSILKNNELLKNVAEKIAKLKIYEEMKNREALFLKSVQDVISYNLTEDQEKIKSELHRFNREKIFSGFLSNEDILVLENVVPNKEDKKTSMQDQAKAFALAVKDIGQEKLSEKMKSQEMIDWESDFIEYVELYIKRQVMSTIDVQDLSINDLDFIREQVSLVENRPSEILEEYLFKPHVGLAGVLFSRAPHTGERTIFNNDKKLLLKDLFIASLNKPSYYIDDVDYSDTHNLLLKYEPEYKDIHYNNKIVKSSFKYLSMEEAFKLNYQQRIYIPNSDSSSYELEREFENIKNLSVDDWQRLFKLNKNNLILNEENKMYYRIKTLKDWKKIDVKNFIDEDIAYIVISDVLQEINSNFSDNYILKGEDVKKFMSIKDADFYFNNKFLESLNENSAKNNNRYADLLNAFRSIFSNDEKKIKEDCAAVDWTNIIHISERKTTAFLLSMNIFLEKFEKEGDKEKLTFMINFAAKMFNKISYYESRQENLIDERSHQIELLILSTYLLKNKDLLINKNNDEELITHINSVANLALDNTIVSNITKKLNNGSNAITIEEKTVNYWKEKTQNEFFDQFKVNGEFSAHNILNILLSKSVSKENDYAEEHFLPMSKKINLIKVLLDNLDNEFVADILSSTDIMKNLTGRKWGMEDVLKEVFKEYLGEKYSYFKVHNILISDYLDNPSQAVRYADEFVIKADNNKDLIKLANNLIENNKQNLSLSPQERMLKKIDEKIKSTKIDQKTKSLLSSIEILGILPLSEQDKYDILQKKSDISVRLNSLEEQKESEFVLPYPYEEMIALFKKSFTMAEQVSLEIKDELKNLGWSDFDINVFDFSNIRLNNLKSSSITEQQKQEFRETREKVLPKYYTKEVLFENPLLLAPLNLTFKFLLEKLPNKFIEHEKYRKIFQTYILEQYDGCSLNKISVMDEFEMSNYNFPFSIVKYRDLSQDKEKLDIVLENKKDLCLKDKDFALINHEMMDNLMSYNSFRKIEELISLVEKNEVKQILLHDNKIKNFEFLKEQYRISFNNFVENLSSDEKEILLDKANDAIQRQNILIKEFNERNPEQSKDLLLEIKECKLVYDLLVIDENNAFGYGVINNCEDYVILLNNRQLLEREQQIASHPMFTNATKHRLIDADLDKGVYDQNNVKKLLSLMSNFNKGFNISIEQKLKWVDEFGDKIFEKEMTDNRFLEIPKAFDRSDRYISVISNGKIQELLEIYEKYKKEGGVKYFLAHIVLHKTIAEELGYEYLNGKKNQYKKETYNSVGSLLFFQYIDLNEITKVISENIKDEDLIGKAFYYTVGTVSNNSFKYGEKENVEIIASEIEEINGKQEEQRFIELLNKTVNDVVSKLSEANLNILKYKKIYGIDVEKIENYVEILKNQNKKDLSGNIFDLAYSQFKNKKNTIIYPSNRYEFHGIEEIIMKKMELNQVAELANLLYFAENKRINYFRENTFFYQLREKLKFEYKQVNSAQQYDEFLKICSKIKDQEIYEDIKAYSRMESLYGQMNDPDKKTKRKKI